MNAVSAVSTQNRARVACVVVLALTVLQLAVGAVSDLDQFQGKGFAGRLVAYPALMLLVPAIYARRRRRAATPRALPWSAFLLIMLPFLVDISGNTLDLYDRVAWWDDANHLVNWFLLSLGVGLLLAAADVRPRWALGWLIGGLGALLAIAWELAEWVLFIRHGTELASAYQDTLGDLLLGSLGACAAGWLVVRRRRDVASRHVPEHQDPAPAVHR